MPCRDPPQRVVGAVEPLEILAPAAQFGGVAALVDIGVERVGFGPDREVDDQLWIGRRLQRGGIAVLGLEPPDEAGCGLGEGVDRIERGEKRGDARISLGGDQPGDVDLGELPVGVL